MTEPGNPTKETKKKVRSVLGLWKAVERLEKEYPGGKVLLMDGSAPFDILVIDSYSGRIIAIEVKSAAPSSSASRSLSTNQKALKEILESRREWKVAFDKYVMYGQPGAEVTVMKVG